MNTFETSATVDDEGRVQIIGIPFAAGTEVQVAISPKKQARVEMTSLDDDALGTARARMRELFRTIKGFRNSPRIPREELYDRGSLC